MKRIVRLLLLISLLSACQPFVELPISDVTSTPAIITFVTPVPSFTTLPTTAPVSPSATITPMIVAPVSANPLTLNELNAGMEMKRLNVIGTGIPHDIKFSPDGKLLAVATGRGVFIYDAIKFEQKSFIDVNDSVSAIAFSPDGNVLAVGIDGKASLRNVLSGQNILELEGEMISISSLGYGRGGYLAALGGECRGCGTPVLGMILWDAKSGRQIYAEHEIPYSTSALTFTDDGKQLIFGGKRGVTIIESETGKLVNIYNGGKDSHFPYTMALTNDETHFIISTSFFNELSMIADLATQEESRLSHCGLYITRAREIAACSKQKSIVIIDGVNGQEIKSLEIDVDAEILREMFALSPDGNFLVYYGKYGLYILETGSGNKIKTLYFTDFTSAQAGIVEIDGIEKHVAGTLTYSGQVEIFDIQTGGLTRTLSLDCCKITGFAFAPDRQTVATVDTTILRLWDLQLSESIYEVDLKEDFSGPLAFSPDGSRVFLTHIAEDHVLELNLQSGKIIDQGKNSYAYDYADPFAVDNFHFNRQGNLVMFEYEKEGAEYHLSFRDVVTGVKSILPYNAVSDGQFLETFAISADGEYLAFGNPEGIFVWDIASQKQLLRFDKHEFRGGDGWIGSIRSLMFNPQSNLLVSVGWDETTRLWSVTTGNELRTLNVCCSANFTPDGHFLITAGDGAIRVWGIP